MLSSLGTNRCYYHYDTLSHTHSCFRCGRCQGAPSALFVLLIPDIVMAESRGMIFFWTSSRGPGLRANFSFRSSASRARFSLIWASREEPSEAGSAQQHSSSTPSTGSQKAGTVTTLNNAIRLVKEICSRCENTWKISGKSKQDN